MSKGTNTEKKIIKENNIFARIWNIYYKNSEIFNYLIVGFLTTLVSLSVYFLLTRMILNPNNMLDIQIANVISWIIAVIFAYITNKIFVFKSKNKKYFKEFIKFILARCTSLLMDMATMFIIVSVLSISDVIGKIVSQIVVLVLNYLFSKIFVFKK